MKVKAFSADIGGRVQGVGFRWNAAALAGRLGLTGWVRNTGGGGVEVWAEGSEASLKPFIDWLNTGPPGARVDRVHITWAKPLGVYRTFGIERL